ncbi:DedA family protein [Rhodococcus pyridinivorans]|uniref:Membrane protein n=2 Tax=Rhodococcus pyridinivorans TaxID=103816 RepID=V9XM41_9NOCA|nr:MULTISPECIES: DedA family protein [Rhodococcus]AHD23448.1 membrane protein [Rhodococcus pyridinivorans SB3094]KSZ56475.1 membrane protein [Rhodococcus pyridinivorans KG-16]MCT7293425.1 DedA family protein [Rhodococcus sp. PAE-6]UPK63647.1 DedA family protein [Rhodococcus pyridinivorans]UTM38612.1 DedA family protein [Rhodococcus pyridinivorans]
MSVADSQSAPTDGLAGWALDLMDRLGGVGAGIAIALENFFPPLPSEVILPLAGFAASLGSFTLFGALFWTTLGSVVGALGLYSIGRWVGEDRIRKVVRKLPLVDVEDLDRSTAWFERHGRKAVFFGRMVPVFRSLISIPAGVTQMPIWQFLAFTTAGSLIWNSIFVLAGYQLGENWSAVEPYASVLQYVVIAVVVAVIGYALVKRIRSRSKDSASESRD